jgi:hypothetical protein
MPTPAMTAEQKQEAVDALEKYGSQKAASEALGLSRTTFQSRLYAGIQAGIEPVREPWVKPRIRVPARSQYQETPNDFGKPVRVLVWGDAHDSPHIPDKSRFRHLGMLAAELRPDFIVDIGDSLDLDSMSSHATAGSMDDRARPAYLTEIASLTDAYGEFNDTAPPHTEIPRYHLDGNHCYRADRFENANPAAAGVYTLPLQQVFARYNFTNKRYREWLFIEGVGFTHAPINGMGKEVGGVNANQTVSRESTFSIVWGHTHKRELINRPKFGIGKMQEMYRKRLGARPHSVKPFRFLFTDFETIATHGGDILSVPVEDGEGKARTLA